MRVRQIDHVLDLFEYYAGEKQPLTLTAMARALSIPKSSAFNMIETLQTRGYIYETRPRGGYLPTRRLALLGREMMEGDRLVETIHSELEELAAATGETALLSVRDAQEIIYVDVVESASLIRYISQIGDRRAIQTTSSGKAILSSYSPEERITILQSIDFDACPLYGDARPNSTSHSIEALEQDLDQAIQRGWCEDRAETTPDVMGLGIPIVAGERRFGLALAGPLYRMEHRRDQLVSLLKTAANRIHEIADET